MYANKHIELFEKIPFKEFYASKPLFEEMIALRNKFVRPEQVLKIYYYIAEEIYDKCDTRFIVRDILSSYDYHDTVTGSHWGVNHKHYIKPKKFNDVLGKGGFNKKPRNPYGLIITAKPSISKKDLSMTGKNSGTLSFGLWLQPELESANLFKLKLSTLNLGILTCIQREENSAAFTFPKNLNRRRVFG